MLVGTGASLAPTGTGTITANKFITGVSTTDAVDLQTSEVAGNLPIGNIAPSATNNRFLVTNSVGATEWITLVGGAGLTYTESTATFDVNVDDLTIEINSDELRVKASGITANEIASGAVGTDEIENGAIINADVSASAAIAGTKISPNFGSQNVTTSGNISTTGTGTLAVGGTSTLGDDVTVGTGTFSYGTSDPDLFVQGNLEVLGTIYGNINGSMSGALTEGNGIADFSYDGSANAQVAVNKDATLAFTVGVLGIDLSHANTWTGVQTFGTAAHLVTSSLAPSGSGTITANKFITGASTTDAVDLATSEVAGILPDANVSNTLTITSGSIDGTPIGGTVTSTGAFSTLSASSTFTLTGLSTDNTDVTVLTINGSGAVHTQSLSNLSSFGNIVTKTSDYTATLTDGTIVVDASGGDVTISLPAATSGEGFKLSIKKIDTSDNNVVIDANSTETIDGQTTMTWNVPWQGYVVQCNGSGWYIVGKI
jgi:hypothetical protein